MTAPAAAGVRGEAALSRSSAPGELVDWMTDAHPGLANPYTLWVAACDQLGT